MKTIARDLMTQPALSIGREMPTHEALVFAKMHDIHHLPIASDGQIIGLVCTCDLRDLDLEEPASRAIKREVVVVSPDDTCRRIAELMHRECIGSVLVRDTHAWGIVTKEDILNANLKDTAALELMETCRCMYCRASRHLRRHGHQFACVTCLDRANNPDRFEGGVVD